jgi:hypothetical protein
MATKNYTVWVGGGEVNDCYLNKKDAYALAKEWRDKGYDDVSVEKNNDFGTVEIYSDKGELIYQNGKEI